jgi:hypothetical protein
MSALPPKADIGIDRVAIEVALRQSIINLREHVLEFPASLHVPSILPGSANLSRRMLGAAQACRFAFCRD